MHTGFALGACHGDHVGVLALVRDDLLPFHHPVNRLDLIPVDSRFLVIKVFRGLRHGFFEAVHDRICAPLKETAQVVDHLTILLLVDRTDTGGRTELDIVIQAGAFVIAGDLTRAGEVGEDLAQDVERLVYCPNRCVRSEVAGTVVDHVSCDREFGERVRPMHLDVGIPFVIL